MYRQDALPSGVSMPSRRTSKCVCCGDLFKPDVRNRGRQKYCSKPQCRGAGKAARQRRWLHKPENRDYFRGPEHVQRVRVWRAAHPGYWRSHRRREAVALQDALAPQVVEPVKDFTARALQDALTLQGPVLIGLIAHLSDSALQDDIATATRRLLQLGQDILSGRASHARQKMGAGP